MHSSIIRHSHESENPVSSTSESRLMRGWRQITASSFPRKRESSLIYPWISACAGMAANHCIVIPAKAGIQLSAE